MLFKKNAFKRNELKSMIIIRLILSAIIIYGSSSLGAQADTTDNMFSDGRKGIVKYHEKKDVFPKMSVHLDWYIDDIGPGYSYGLIRKGQYAGAELVSAVFNSGGPWKGRCYEQQWVRFLKKGNELIYLPKNSSAILDMQLWPSTFSSHGFSLTSDKEFNLELFNETQKLEYKSHEFKRICLKGRLPKKDDLKIIFQHSVYGDVFFNGINFYVIRRDGSSLIFEYIPFVTIDGIAWNSTPVIPNKSGYSWKKEDNYGGRRFVRYDSFVSTAEVNPDRDLIKIGSTEKGELIYGLEDENHLLIIKFYNDYQKDLEDNSLYMIEKKTPVSFEDFSRSIPIFFWKDPFGRLMRFSNNDYLPIYMAEPIIYLYPVIDQKVKVTVHAKKGVKKSEPLYKNGWNVQSAVDGTITDMQSGKEYPYLFWEGYGPVSPMREEGYVVLKENVSDLFDSVLPSLGLNMNETEDFKKAWIPQFQGSKYYFITFIDQEVIDQFVPLEIDPKPDTVIRILMDYQPLNNKKTVNPPQFSSPPKRTGFTVVEWGGIQRF